MNALISLLFLCLPVLLMIWMMALQRRQRRQSRSDAGGPHVEPWIESVKTEGGLSYAKNHSPNEELSEADGRVEDANRIRNLGIGL